MIRKPKKYSGVVVPMITPVTQDGKIDYDSVLRISNSLTQNKCHPFIIGTTGEAASISLAEKLEYVKIMGQSNMGGSTLYAGISGNCLSESVEAAKLYLDCGVDVLVAHLPSYYPVNEYHMLNYFEKLATQINGPVVIYNIPGTTHHSIPLKLVEKLSYIENIVGLKDSERDLERLENSIQLFKDREDFSHLVGWGAQCCFSLYMGSDGIVPSTGNISPKLYSDIYNNVLSDQYDIAMDMQNVTDEISKIYQRGKILSEALAALKIMMSELNICEEYVLPPLTELDKEESETIRSQTRKITSLYNLKGFEK